MNKKELIEKRLTEIWEAIEALIENSDATERVIEQSAKPDTGPDRQGDREKYYHIIKNCTRCGEPTLQTPSKEEGEDG
jgi:hypothetical protein